MKIALKGLDLWGEKMLDFLAPKRACFTQRAVFREEEALKFGNTPVKKNKLECLSRVDETNQQRYVRRNVW